MYTINKNFSKIDNLAEEICGIYAENNDFVILCDSDIASVLTKRFLQFAEDTVAFDIELSNPCIDDYCGEYCVANVDNNLFCSKARRNGKPIGVSDEIPVYVQENFVGDDFLDEEYVGNVIIKFKIKE